jgi:hypothetical protein
MMNEQMIVELGEMIRGNRKCLENTVTLSTTNPTWIGLGSNPDLCSERQANNCLRHSMVFMSVYCTLKRRHNSL